MKGIDRRTHAVLIAILAVMLLPFCLSVEGQSRDKAKDNKDAFAGNDPQNDLTRWQFMLDQLSGEARDLPRKESRAVALAEIADAYWKLNKERAKDLFSSSLESALSSDVAKKEASAAVRRILSLASIRDYDFAGQLTSRVIEQREKDDRAAYTPVAAALDLLHQDPQAAARLAEAAVRVGPSRDAAWLIFQLASVDSAAAEQVYRACLKSFGSGLIPDIDKLLWLAGYPFGYAEAWGGARNVSQMMGFGGFRATGITPNPALAAVYLDIALQSVRATLDQAMRTPSPENDALNSLALFAVNYLSPEVARYRQETMPAWLILRRQAMAGTSPARQQVVADRIQKINELRASTIEHDSPESYADSRARSDLEHAESLPDGCQRDQSYAKAALGVAASKDFSRALSINDKIKEISLRERVRQYIYFDMSVAATIAGNLDEARLHADHVTQRQQRTLLYAKIAEEALRKKDRTRAGEILRETVRLADGVEDPGEQAAVLLAAAAVFSEFDQFETDQTIKLAIKAANRVEAQNTDDFAVLRKVSLSCSGDGFPLYGSSEKAERFSLIQSLTSLVRADTEGVILMARGIKDPVVRIRALASIIRAVTKN